MQKNLKCRFAKGTLSTEHLAKLFSIYRTRVTFHHLFMTVGNQFRIVLIVFMILMRAIVSALAQLWEPRWSYSPLALYFCLSFAGRRILQILCTKRTAFARSAIILQKVNRFGWNLEHCELSIGIWRWWILGAIRAVATALKGAEFCVR